MTYSMQVGLLVGLAAFIPNLLRLRLPSARLAFWQILLVACLLLPAGPAVEAGGDRRRRVSSPRTIVAVQTSQPAPFHMPVGDRAGIAVLARRRACAASAGWRAGFWKLRAPAPPLAAVSRRH